MAQDSYKIHRLGLTNVAAYLIYRPGEAILVDSGNKGSEDTILKLLRRLGLEPEMLKLLILTHVHFDHAGSAQRLKELTACKIMVHQSEEARLREGKTPIPAGTRWKAKFLVRWEDFLPGVLALFLAQNRTYWSPIPLTWRSLASRER